MTPTTAATGKQLTITNTKDVNNFVYPSLYSLANLSFKNPPFIVHIDASNTSSYTTRSQDGYQYVTSWSGFSSPISTDQPYLLNGGVSFKSTATNLHPRLKYDTNPTEINKMYLNNKVLFFVVEDSGLFNGERYMLNLEPYGSGGLIFGSWGTNQMRITNTIMYDKPGAVPVNRKEVYALSVTGYPDGISKFYVNNTKVYEQPTSSNQILKSTLYSAMSLGGRFDGDKIWSYWSGSIYELKITEETMTDIQIITHMNELKLKWGVA
jgi:hypothetical protein